MARKVIGKMEMPPPSEEQSVVAPQNEQQNKTPETKTEAQTPAPKTQSEELKQVPETQSEQIKQIPEIQTEQTSFRDIQSELAEKNCVKIGDKIIEIKSTKLKYHRNGTYSFYKALDLYTIDEILMAPKGTLDTDRDGDKCLMDLMGALIDDPKFVHDNYNDIDCNTILTALKIAKRLDGFSDIQEKREEKKRQQMGKANP